MTRKYSLLVQAAATTVATGLAQVALAGLYLVAARSAGPGDFGVVATALTTSLALAALVDFGANAYWVRELARSPESLPAFAVRLQAKFAVVGAIAFVAIVSLSLAGADATVVVAPIIAAGTVVVQALSVPLRADRRSERIGVAAMIEKGLALVSMLALVAVGVDALVALVIALALGILAGVLCIWALTPRQRRPRILGAIRRVNPWRGTLHFGIANLASTLSGFDMLALQFGGGAVAAGTYGAVSRWTQPMGLVSSAVTTAAAPFFAAAPTARHALRSFRGAAILLAMNSLACVAVALFAEPIVGLLLGTAYADSAAVLRVLAVAVILSTWNQPISAMLQARDRDRVVAWIRLIAAVLAIAATAVMGAMFGALGAAVSVLGLQVAISLAFVGALWPDVRGLIGARTRM